ncbi:MAG: radical SAM protein [Actinomycetota bacterium]
MYSPLPYVGHIFWKRRPIQLTFFVTRRCNAKCPFCFYIQGQGESQEHKQRKVKGQKQEQIVGQKRDVVNGKQSEISLEEIKSLAPSFGRLLWLAFSGGEVFLREDIVDISRVFYKHNKPVVLLYSTNGLTPELIRNRTEEILKACPNSVVTVKLSLDGLYSDHDALRGVSGSFKKVMKSHQLLGELLDKYPNFELGINTVFCSANQDKIGEIFDFVKKLDNVRTHTLSMVRGELSDASLKDVDLNKYLEAIKAIEADMKKQLTQRYRFLGARLKSAQDILQRRLIHKTMVEDRRMSPCYAGRLNLVLTEVGDVYPCEILSQKLGNVRDSDYDIKKILRSTQAKSVIRNISESKCFCSHECYFMTNILFNPRMYPALLKEYLQLR